MYELLSLNEIFQKHRQEVEDFGFLGSASTPVILERKPKSHIMYALYHAHLDGVCIKSKTGVFCK